MFFNGDFNAHSSNWWTEGNGTPEGIYLQSVFSDLYLTQVIDEPTHFREHCNPSCIDLVITDQPNLVLDPSCKHQITFCKINFSKPPPPAYNRKVWHFDKANLPFITRAISEFPQQQRLNQIIDPYLQVNLLTETILNIVLNFVPNKTIRIKPTEPEWFNRDIRKMLKKQNRIYKKYREMDLRKSIKYPLMFIERNVLQQSKNLNKIIFVNLVTSCLIIVQVKRPIGKFLIAC